jgi:protein involved in sex pheromone biosynthesis
LEIDVTIDFYDVTERLSCLQLIGEIVKTTFTADNNVSVVLRSSMSEVYGVIKYPPQGEVSVMPL